MTIDYKIIGLVSQKYAPGIMPSATRPWSRLAYIVLQTMKNADFIERGKIPLLRRTSSKEMSSVHKGCPYQGVGQYTNLYNFDVRRWPLAKSFDVEGWLRHILSFNPVTLDFYPYRGMITRENLWSRGCTNCHPWNWEYMSKSLPKFRRECKSHPRWIKTALPIDSQWQRITSKLTRF